MAQELNFNDWMAAVKAEATKVLGHDNIEWLIGGEAEMKEGFADDMSPSEYVGEQVANID